MPRMRGSAISGKPFRRGSLDLDTKAPLKRIRSSVNLWFDKVFGDVHLSPCPLEQVLGDDRPPDRRGRGHNGSWRALVMYTCWWLGVIHSRAPLRVEHSLRKSLVKAKPLPEAEMSCHSPLSTVITWVGSGTMSNDFVHMRIDYLGTRPWLMQQQQHTIGSSSTWRRGSCSRRPQRQQRHVEQQQRHERKHH